MDWWNKSKERVARYNDIDEAREWFEKNQSRVGALNNNYSLRDFVFEPFKGVFQTSAKTIDANIYSTIPDPTFHLCSIQIYIFDRFH